MCLVAMSPDHPLGAPAVRPYSSKKAPHMAGLLNLRLPGQRNLHHTAHTTHIRHTTPRRTTGVFLRRFGNHGLGG